jgi:hypothetical protein
MTLAAIFATWSWAGDTANRVAGIINDATVASNKDGGGSIEVGDTLDNADNIDRQIVVYYFHGDKRCSSCLQIESITKEAIDSAFAGAMRDSLLTWRVINTDEDQNKHFILDYQLFTKSVIVSDWRNGKELRWKNLEKVWEFLGNETAFKKYVIDEIQVYSEKD